MSFPGFCVGSWSCHVTSPRHVVEGVVGGDIPGPPDEVDEPDDHDYTIRAVLSVYTMHVACRYHHVGMSICYGYAHRTCHTRAPRLFHFAHSSWPLGMEGSSKAHAAGPLPYLRQPVPDSPIRPVSSVRLPFALSAVDIDKTRGSGMSQRSMGEGARKRGSPSMMHVAAGEPYWHQMLPGPYGRQRSMVGQ